jgi:anthranilate phosphoribosyltransferase
VLTDAIARASQRTHLTRDHVARVFDEIFSGRATSAQIAALLIALRMKGETVEEVTGAALALRQRARPLRRPVATVVLDTCGTGGDGLGTFNISTAVALVACAAGVTVAKHGNGGISSRCGSADVLKAAGVRLDASVSRVEECMDELGIAFLLAPMFHPVMREVASVRRELGVRSIFNILGPLANPAGANCQLVGVYAASLVPTVAGALSALGTERSLVVHGDDGLDEVSPCGPTTAALVERGTITTLTLVPEDADVERLPLDALRGDGPEENARALRSVLTGATGPLREAVVLNAAAALWVAGKCSGLREGAARARQVLDEGSAARKLAALAELTSRPEGEDAAR